MLRISWDKERALLTDSLDDSYAHSSLRTIKLNVDIERILFFHCSLDWVSPVFYLSTAQDSFL